jgi:hypothetical protein
MYRRKRLLVADEVQYLLLLRITIHWIIFLVATCIALAVWIYWIDMPLATTAEKHTAFLRICIPLLVCSLVTVPVFVYDIAKLSNQFAGPITRIRASLARYLDSGMIDPVNLRKRDCWQGLANDFNRLLHRREEKVSSPDNQIIAKD